jgi:signal transduction histidine kinase
MVHRWDVERGVLIGVAGLRWAAWTWLAIVALADLHRVRHPIVAVAAIAATGAVTLATSVAVRGREWRRALAPPLIGAEVAVAALVVLADAWVRQGPITGQTLAGTWPLPAILVAAVAGGVWWGVGAAAVLSATRGIAVVLGAAAHGATGRAAVATVSTAVSWIAIGAVCGTIVRLLREAQGQLAEAEARDAVARDLHDGVLQTLALIERRADSPEIAALAREQERDLRAYLFNGRKEVGGLPAQLRAVADRFERTWSNTKVTVTASDDLPQVTADQISAVSGAVTEALTNAAKHGAARRVVVFADLDEQTGGVFVSVKDDGSGFDPTAVVEGVGMTRSIRERITAAGGTVTIASAPGDGVDVRIAIGRRRG